jgi:hypothetical protein
MAGLCRNLHPAAMQAVQGGGTEAVKPPKGTKRDQHWTTPKCTSQNQFTTLQTKGAIENSQRCEPFCLFAKSVIRPPNKCMIVVHQPAHRRAWSCRSSGFSHTHTEPAAVPRPLSLFSELHFSTEPACKQLLLSQLSSTRRRRHASAALRGDVRGPPAALPGDGRGRMET